jgi:son of sevenless
MNIFKQMISDDDLLEKADMYILERIKDFITSPEVAGTAPAKALNALLDRRAVRRWRI